MQFKNVSQSFVHLISSLYEIQIPPKKFQIKNMIFSIFWMLFAIVFAPYVI